MSGRLRLRRTVSGVVSVSLAAIAGCTATPRYPVVAGAAAGDGFQPITPRYPIAEAPAPSSAATLDAETPIAAATPSAASSTMIEARSAPVAESPLAPLHSDAARPSFAGEPAPRTSSSASAPPSAPLRLRRIPGALTYTLARGDTLYGVARRFGVGPAALAAANGLSPQAPLRPGMRLKLPADSRDGGEQIHAAGAAERAATRTVAVAPPPPRHVEPPGLRRSAEAVAPEAPIPYEQLVRRTRANRQEPRAIVARTAPPSLPSDVEAAAPPPAGSEPASDGAALRSVRGRFIRPVHGPTLSAFGAKGPGQRNDGVDLAAREGEVVRASAAGVVVYAGHDVPALGNLVAVKHADGWVTVYGNLEKITVRPTERLVQGAPIGLAGATAATPTPQVHFEVRYASDPSDKAHPVDPERVLPKAG